MVRHVAGIGEIVEDVASAARFYRDTLGLVVDGEEPDHAMVKVPGVLYYGLWSRAAAAESTFGDRAAADRIPLGFSVGFEVDEVDSATESLDLISKPKTEPWGQRTARFVLPGGGLGEVIETPWARAYRSTSSVLASMLDMTNTYLAQRLEGMTDEEWLWEPVPGCWTVRGGELDYVVPEPETPPFTTIAWRLFHIQGCNEVYTNWLAGDATARWDDSVRVAASAEDARERWLASASAFREAVASFSDVELAANYATPRGDSGLPRVFLISTTVRENIHHGAEVGVLRDLYRETRGAAFKHR